MSNKMKIISADDIEKYINDRYQHTAVAEWNGLEIVVKRHLSLAEATKFVDACVNACFDSDTAVYAPEMKDTAIGSSIVAFYTNIDLPESVEKQYELIYHSEILDSIKPYIDQNQLNSIICAVDKKVEYLVRVNTEMVNRQIRDLQSAAENIQNQLSDMFNDINIDDVKNVIGSLSEKGLDEEKLVKAYLESKS